MSERKNMIRERLREIAGEESPLQTILLTVASRDDDACTVIAEDDEGTPYTDVRLRAVITGNHSQTVYPKIGSYVLCLRIEADHDWLVIWAEQIDKINITIGDCVFESDGTKWSLKNSTADLKSILTNIIEAVQQIVVLYGNNPDYEKLTSSLTDVNNLFT